MWMAASWPTLANNPEEVAVQPIYADLKDKVAVVTGGSGVLCSEMARALANAGCKVAILNRTREKGQRVADAIGENAIAIAADVLDKASLEKAREQINEKWGRVSILINGAGGNNPMATTQDEHYDPAARDIKDFFALDPDGIRQVFDLNFQGTVLPTLVFAKDLVGMPGANIINISSMASYQPLTKVMAYAAAKAAVNNFTSWLATYFAKSGVRVNAIAPGFFATDQNRALLFNEDGTPTPRTGKILAATPMGRFGEAKELVGATLFLASEQAAGFVTGIVVQVDGGFMAYSGV